MTPQELHDATSFMLEPMLTGGADWSVPAWHIRDSLFLTASDDLDSWQLIQRFESCGEWAIVELVDFKGDWSEAINHCAVIAAGERAPGERDDDSGEPVTVRALELRR